MNNAYIFLGMFLGGLWVFMILVLFATSMLLKKVKIEKRIAEIKNETEEISFKIQLQKANTKDTKR